MSKIGPVRGAAARAEDAAARLGERWSLSRAAVAWLAGSTVLLVSLAMLLGKLTEDVMAGNGWESGDLTEVEQVAAHRDPALVNTALLFTRLGSVPVLLLIAVAAAGLLWWRGKRLFVALAPLAALLFAGTATAIGKHLIGRERPPMWLHLVPEGDASFPSGHSGDSAALFLTLGLICAALVFTSRRARAAIAGLSGVLVAGVASSRIVLGVHYPTDVLAGLAIGTSTALVVSAVTILAAGKLLDTRPQGGPPRQLVGTKALVARSRPRPPSGSSAIRAAGRPSL